MSEWADAYETPTALDAQRVIGRHARRPTVCTLAGTAGVALSAAGTVVLDQPALAGGVVVSALGAYALAKPWGQRPFEHWLRVWARDRRLPRTLGERELLRWHGNLQVRDHVVLDQATQTPRVVVEIEQTPNLRLSDDETLGSHVRRLGAWLNSLRFPVHVVVRAWPNGGLIARRWFVAVSANSEAVLSERLESVVAGLGRAGLRGRAKNGDLYDTLSVCWSPSARAQLGPRQIKRHARAAEVDGELVRGFWLARMPRVVEPNWLAPILDGDLAADTGWWIEPTDIADEIADLDGRLDDYQARQYLSVRDRGIRDDDADEVIEDFRRVRSDLNRRRLRVFRCSAAFVVRGKTGRDLDGRERQLVDLLREQVGDDPLIPMHYEHDLAPLLTVPLAEPPVVYPMRVVTPALARSYLFSNSSVSMAGGVDVGTSLGSNRPNRLNLFGFPNPHMLVLATSGAGKGYWTKVFLKRWLEQDDNLTVFVVQVYKDEYGPLAESLGEYVGEHLRWPLGAKVDLDSSEAVEGVVRYGRLWAPPVRCVVLNLLPMAEKQRGAALARIIGAIDNLTSWVKEAPESTRRFALVVDELGIVLDDDEAEHAVSRAFRSFRQNRCACIGISQRSSDLLDRRVGKVLADIALCQVYLRQRPTEMRVVAKQLGLSPEEQSLLEEADVGTGILVADHQHVGFRLTASEAEHNMASTS